MSEPIKDLASNFTKAKFSHFVEKESSRRFEEWLSYFLVEKGAIPPPVGEVVPSSDHDEGVGAIWYKSGDFVFGSAETGNAYRIPPSELASMPAVNLTEL